MKSENRKEKRENGQTGRVARCHFPISIFYFLMAALLCFPASAMSQEEELVVNLSAGRVVVLVAKDGIAVGAVEEKLEANSRPPVVVQLSGTRIAILLGAVEWVQAGGAVPPVRMDLKLAEVSSQIRLPQAASGPPTPQPDEQANDIEQLGLGMLEALRPLATQLHRKVELGEEPLLEIVLVGYVPDYGPEVWSIRYGIAQEPLRGDYLRTRVLRPRYTQYYPPEKGQPRTLVEVHYPASREQSLLMRAQNDAKLETLRTGDAELARVSASLTKGESHKGKMSEATTWLRALLNATSPQDAAMFVGGISEEKGLDWALPPAERTTKAEDKTREPGAPTLRKKP
jgi:hypothetical protein